MEVVNLVVFVALILGFLLLFLLPGRWSPRRPPRIPAPERRDDPIPRQSLPPRRRLPDDLN